MATITELAAQAWRDFEIDEVSDSGAHHPEKSAIREVMAAIDTQKVEAVADLAALKALTNRPSIVRVQTGRAKDAWRWDANSSTTADDALVVQCTSGASGRYKRVIGSYIDASWFVSDLANARAGINAALTAASTTTGSVILPKGASDYIIDASLVQPPGVAFIGIGYPTIKLKSACDPIPPTMITANGTAEARIANIVLQGIAFDGNRENNINHGTPDEDGNQVPGYEGLPLAAAAYGFIDGIKIRDCHVKNMWCSGLWLVDCTDEEIDSNRVVDFRKTGISIRRIVPLETPGATTFRITNNYVNGGGVGIHSGIFGTGRGICANNNVENCRDRNENPSFAWAGTWPNLYPIGDGQAWAEPGDPGYVTAALDGDGAGIELSGFNTAVGAEHERWITVIGNVCYDNIVGLRFEQECKNFTAIGNICSSNDKYGIFGFSCTDATISGNEVEDNGEHGIYIAKCDGQAVPTYLNIIGNRVARNGMFGICLQRVVASVVTGNFLVDNWQNGTGAGGAFGVYSDGSDRCNFVKMHGNFINQTGGDWVYYDNTGHASMTLTENDFYGTPSNKFVNMNRTNTTVRGNVGIVTRNRGSATVPQNSFVAITHGLDFTPNTADIRFNAISALSGGEMYLSPTPGATTFDLIMVGGPTTLPVTWSIDDA